MTPLAQLLSGRFGRSEPPHPDLLAISVAAGEQRGVLVFCFAGVAAGVGFARARPHGQAATSFVQKLRKELEGARLIAFEQPTEASVALVTQRGELRRVLVCDFLTPEIRLQDESAAPLAQQTPQRAQKPRRIEAQWPASLEELEARGPLLLEGRAERALAAQRAQLGKALRSAEQRLQRRLEALAGDVQRAEGAAALRARATLLIANQHALRRGMTSAQLVDYTLDPPGEVSIELAPELSAKEQAEAWFKRARRFERGAELAQTRIASTHAEISALHAVSSALASADAAELEQLAQQARALGVRGVETGPALAKKTRTSRRKPYREFLGDKQRPILVGKGAEQNDELVREHARPQDLWLHARDVSGAHVVVPLERNEQCPEQLLLDAAHLAAHFSGSRGASSADVSYTSRRYLRKPRGAAAGAVQVEREKVIRLALEPTRLARLLASEIAG
jgi:predicted ribosome quality control (RQC) complex YloA/Tae2 family protein